MTSTIGIIGSGNIGSALARAFTAFGHPVVIANSRGPASLAPLVAELGDLATAGTVEQAAQAGELVVVTIPLGAVASIPSQLLDGRIVIDTNNYYPARDGQIAELDDESLTTAEYVARHFAGATIVKAFNHIPAREIAGQAQPAGTPDRRALMVYGEDAAAVERVSALVDQIGFDAVIGGGLAASWRIQRDMPAYGPRFTVAELAIKLSEARRYRDQ
ncbi:MAG: NADP oxidoreductase [Microbacterium sp.]|nr:NADP oxidoreductase [Microbacterium sp.]MBA4345524.1 NADP oxidoreductase [Microbacterium sp.]